MQEDIRGVSVRIEHVVLRDPQINKSSKNLRNGFFETHVLVVTELNNFSATWCALNPKAFILP